MPTRVKSRQPVAVAVARIDPTTMLTIALQTVQDSQRQPRSLTDASGQPRK
jgi:hypothetical protein